PRNDKNFSFFASCSACATQPTKRDAETNRTEKLSLRLHFRCAARPVRFELVIRDAHVSIDVAVPDDEVIARTCLKKLLLQREPGGFVQPQLNFGKLLANFVGFRQQLKPKDFVVVQHFLALQRNRVTFFQRTSGSAETKQQELIDNGFFLSEIVFLDAVNLRV